MERSHWILVACCPDTGWESQVMQLQGLHQSPDYTRIVLLVKYLHEYANGLVAAKICPFSASCWALLRLASQPHLYARTLRRIKRETATATDIPTIEPVES